MPHLAKSLLAAPFMVAALSFGAPEPASAQQQAGLVNVNISQIRDLLQVEIGDVALNIPVVVQVPIGIAANVCPGDITAAVLAQQARGGGGQAECEAETTSQAFNNQMIRQFGDG